MCPVQLGFPDTARPDKNATQQLPAASRRKEKEASIVVAVVCVLVVSLCVWLCWFGVLWGVGCCLPVLWWFLFFWLLFFFFFGLPCDYSSSFDFVVFAHLLQPLVLPLHISIQPINANELSLLVTVAFSFFFLLCVCVCIIFPSTSSSSSSSSPSFSPFLESLPSSSAPF